MRLCETPRSCVIKCSLIHNFRFTSPSCSWAFEDLFTSEINSQFACARGKDNTTSSKGLSRLRSWNTAAWSMMTAMLALQGSRERRSTIRWKPSEIALTILQAFAIDADKLKGARGAHSGPSGVPASATSARFGRQQICGHSVWDSAAAFRLRNKHFIPAL